MNYNYNFNYGQYEIDLADKVFAFTGAMAIVMTIVGVAFIVISLMINWKLFQKAGIKGWKSIIPIYNLYLIIKIAYNEDRGLYLLIFLIPIVNVIYAMYLKYKFATAYTENDALGIINVFYSLLVGLLLAFNNKYQYKYKRFHELDGSDEHARKEDGFEYKEYYYEDDNGGDNE